jgi:hypothetical protein
MGYILRLTERNRYETPTWIFKLINPQHKEDNQNCKIIFEPTQYLNSLAHVINIQVDKLRQLIYPNASNSDGAYSSYFFGQEVSTYAIQITHLKICPDCLLEAPYCRRIWELPIITTCPTHKRLLIDKCPNCNKRISWFRKTVCICPCEFDWRKSPPAPVEESELKLAHHIYRLCRLSLDSYSISKSVNENPIYSLTLQGTLSALFFIAGQHQGLSATTNKNLLRSGRNWDFHLLFTKAFSVFEDWPNNYYLFLDWVRERELSAPPNRRRQKSILYIEFGKFYVSLFKILSGSQFNFIRKAFVEYLIKRWEGYYVSSYDPKRRTTHHYKSKYISRSDAIRLLGTDEEQIKWLIQMDKIRITVRSKGKRRLFYVDVTDIKKLMRKAS